MDSFKRWRLTGWTALLLAAVGVLWIIFAPLQFGGRVSYVMVDGNSMEPTYHKGDLVLVRSAVEYQVGDVVAYQNGDLNRIVIHRIIARQGGRYLIQGDHNTWVDQYQPTAGEILGKQWIYLASLGKYIQKLRSPAAAAAAAAALGVLLMTLLSNPKNEKTDQKTLPTFHVSFRNISQNGEILTLVLGILFFLSLFLAVFSFTHSPQQTVSDDLEYVQSGSFVYQATAPEGVYDTRSPQPGEPVFMNLSNSLQVDFFYHLVSEDASQISGNYQMQAVLSEASGLKRRIELTPLAAFEGEQFSLSGSLDLGQVQTIIQEIEEKTGYSRPRYTLSFEPVVQVIGSVADRPLTAAFAPVLTFNLDGNVLQLAGGDGSGLDFTQGGVISGFKQIPAVLTIFGWKLPVSTARVLSVAGLLLSVLGGLAFWFFIRQATGGEESALIELKYAPMIADVQRMALVGNERVIDVASMDDLVLLAERHAATILHESLGSTHSYFLNHDSLIYRYQMGNGMMIYPNHSLNGMEAEIRAAFERHEFQVYYQPVISLETGKPILVEALLRWVHPVRGVISAAEFLPAVEAAGMMADIDNWVLMTTCGQLKTWREKGLPQISLALNLSPSQLQMKDFQKDVSHYLKNFGVNPHDLRFEMSAGDVLEGMTEITPHMEKLMKLGVQLWVDDFESASSLNLLTRLPVTGLKLDRSLSARAVSNVGDGAVAHALIELAHQMNLRVVVEGIEDQDQADFFRLQHCDEGQGYLFGRPMAVEDFERILVDSGSVIEAV